MALKNFKKGDKVVMFDCMEATLKKNYGRIWECAEDSFQHAFTGTTIEQPELVFLKGFSGTFWCKYLQVVKVNVLPVPSEYCCGYTIEELQAEMANEDKAQEGTLTVGTSAV